MPARSVVLTLQPGIAQAILPDHRKMLPGVEYVVDWDTFEKLSPNARQSIVRVVSVQGDVAPFNGSTTSGTISYPAQWQNPDQVSGEFAADVWNILNEPIAPGYEPPNASWPQFAGFAAQGVDVNGLVGVGDNNSFYGTSQGLKALTGPAGERYLLAYIAYEAFAGGVMTWWDEEAGTACMSTTEPTLGQNQYVVIQDGLGTEYQKPTLDVPTVPPFSGTFNNPDNHSALVGAFAGIATTTFSYSPGWYGWIQVEGFCPRVAVASGIKAGDTLAVDYSFCAGTAKVQGPMVKSVTAQGVVTGTALANNVFGTALTDAVYDADFEGWFAQADIRSARPKKPYNRFLNKN